MSAIILRGTQGRKLFSIVVKREIWSNFLNLHYCFSVKHAICPPPKNIQWNVMVEILPLSSLFRNPQTPLLVSYLPSDHFKWLKLCLSLLSFYHTLPLYHSHYSRLYAVYTIDNDFWWEKEQLNKMSGFFCSKQMEMSANIEKLWDRYLLNVAF